MKIAAYIKEKPIKFALYCVLCVILAFIFIVLGTLLVEKFIKKSKVPMFSGYAMMRIISPSMSGTLEVGDYIIIHKTNDYGRGDIVTFVTSTGDVVTHRIIYFCDPVTGEVTFEYTGAFITRGDANDSTDDKSTIGIIREDQIAGEWVATIPKVGLVFDWFLKENGFVYVIVMIAIIGAIVYFWHDVDKKEPEKADANASDCDGSPGHSEAQSPGHSEAQSPGHSEAEPKNPTNKNEAPKPEDNTSKKDK